MQLSPHFALSEMACRDGCGGENDPLIIADLKSLCANVLEPLRAKLGTPITVNDGFRCAAHNAAVGGVSDSQHLRGRAADIVVPGHSPELVAAMAHHIDSVGGIGTYETFVHVDDRPRSNGVIATWNG